MRSPTRRSPLNVALGLGLALTLGLGLACDRTPSAGGCGDGSSTHDLEVTATAYNSLAGQTSGNPALAAWGDHLEPGMKAIAVSRDLLELGLTHDVEVCIEGLPGRYRVLDKMARRWKRKIDIYMGTDVHAAREWGRRTVRIYWTPPAS